MAVGPCIVRGGTGDPEVVIPVLPGVSGQSRSSTRSMWAAHEPPSIVEICGDVLPSRLPEKIDSSTLFYTTYIHILNRYMLGVMIHQPST